jgi:hypothetical protein
VSRNRLQKAIFKLHLYWTWLFGFWTQSQWLRLALSNGPNWIGLPCPIHLRTETDPVPETLCFYRFYSFEHWTMDRVQKPNNHVQHTPSSESFQVYQEFTVHNVFKIARFTGAHRIFKSDIPLRPIVQFYWFPCYAPTSFLRKILSPPAGKSGSFVKNMGHSVQLLKSVNL